MLNIQRSLNCQYDIQPYNDFEPVGWIQTLYVGKSHKNVPKTGLYFRPGFNLKIYSILV